MKVLIFSLEFPPYVGGAGTYAYELSNALAKIGCEVSVLTRGYENASPVLMGDGNGAVKIYAEKWHSRLWFLFWPRFLDKHLKHHGYDLIICANWSSHVIGHKSKLIRRCRYVTVFHGDEMERYFGKRTLKFSLLINRPRLRRFFTRGERIIAVSKDMKEQLLECGFPDERVSVVLHGINENVFFPVNEQYQIKAEELRKELNIGRAQKILFCAARLEDGKGHDVLLNACATLKTRGVDFKLVLAGGGSLEKELKAQARGLSIEDYVVFCGNVAREKLVSFHHISDVFVLVSRRKGETFGIVYIEANACKKPVIAGRTGGVAESVEDGVSGVLVDPNSEEQVANEIENILTNSDMLLDLGERGYRRFKERFSSEIMARNTIACIE